MNDEAINNMNYSLLNLDSSTLEHMEVNEASEYRITKIQTTMDSFAPERTICVSLKNQLKQTWMTPNTFEYVKNKNKLYHKCLGKDKNSHAYNKYIQYRNNFNRIKTIMKLKYYKEILNQYRNDSRKIWSTLNTLIGKTRNKNDISDMFKIDGKCYSTDTDFITNTVCEY